MKNKINLRDIDIDMIVTSPRFQEKLTENVQSIISNMKKDEYNKAVKQNGSEEGFLENIKKIVLTKMIDQISSKLFWGSSVVLTALLSAIGISNIDGDKFNLDNIDFSKIDWDKIDWSTITFDLSHVENEIFSNGFLNFISWVKDTTIDWTNDTDFS